MRRRRRAEAADDRRDELEDRAQPRRRQRLAAEVERGGAELGSQPRPQRRQLAVRPVEQRLQRAELGLLRRRDVGAAAVDRRRRDARRLDAAARVLGRRRVGRRPRQPRQHGVDELGRHRRRGGGARGVAARELGQLEHAGQPRVHALERAVVEERPRRVQRLEERRVHRSVGLDVAQRLGVERGVQKFERGVALRRVVGERVERGGELRGVV